MTEQIQWCRRTLPGWAFSGSDGLDSDPPTLEEWDWIVKNRPLVMKAVQGTRKGAFNAAHGHGGDDLWSYLVPVLVRCLRNYDPARGTLANLVYKYVWNALAPYRYSPRGSVVKHRYRDFRSAKVELLGYEDECVPDPSWDRDWQDDGGSDRETVAGLLSRLEPRARYVLARRYGLEGHDPATLQDLALELKVTRERVRQIEARALQDVGDAVLSGVRG